MILVGEESGRLEEMLARGADVYDREVQVAVKRFLAILEPALILGLAVLIGGIVLSILLGVLGMTDLREVGLHHSPPISIKVPHTIFEEVDKAIESTRRRSSASRPTTATWPTTTGSSTGSETTRRNAMPSSSAPSWSSVVVAKNEAMPVRFVVPVPP